MTKKLRQITSWQIKAELFQGLYRLEASGIPLQQSLQLLSDNSPEITANIMQLRHAVTKGRTMSESGYKANLFNEVDKEVIRAGEESGNLSSVYEQLAKHYASKVRTAKDIKSKLILPLGMIMLVIFIAPLPNLVLGVISGVEYLAKTIGTIIMLALIIYSLFNIGAFFKAIGLKKQICALELSLPLLSKWTIKRQVHAFFTYLGLLLNAGVSMSSALPTAINTMSNSVLRNKFNAIIESVVQGNSLALALKPIAEIEKITMKQIEVGEQSGRLEQTIIHMSNINEEAIKAETTFIAEWIPRIIYGLVVLVIAYSILSSAKISSI